VSNRAALLLEQSTMKNAQRDANTVADFLPGGAGPPKFNQLEMVTTFTYRHSLVKIDARNFELSWQQTHKHRPPAQGFI